MDRVATMPTNDRAELFRSAGAQMDLDGALVEKDFWVCWTLGHLFDIETVRDVLMFKGGTARASPRSLHNHLHKRLHKLPSTRVKWCHVLAFWRVLKGSFGDPRRAS